MPGFHVVVYSAYMPVWTTPGYVYFVSTGLHDFAKYEIYSTVGGHRHPLVGATYHGTFSDVTVPLPYRPRGPWEVSYWYSNYHGTVDVYTWYAGSWPNSWTYHEAATIGSPHDWWKAYLTYGGNVQMQPLSRRARRLGLARFYRLMV